MSTTDQANEHRNIIDFDHHAPSLRDHNTEVLHRPCCERL